MAHNPPTVPPPEQWPVVAPPDCPNDCDSPGDVTWRGPIDSLDYGPAHLWECGACCAEWAIPITCWPVEDGPDCPSCGTEVTCWAALAPDEHGDLWICQDGHEFVFTLTPEGLIILPGDAA